MDSFNSTNYKGTYKIILISQTIHVILILQVLILPKLLSLVPKYLKDIIPSEEEYLSNVYSRNELLLLAWLNHHFEKKGRSMFRSGNK